MPYVNKKKTKFRKKNRIVLPTQLIAEYFVNKMNVLKQEGKKQIKIGGRTFDMGINKVKRKRLTFLVDILSNQKSQYKLLGLKEEDNWKEINTKDVLLYVG